MRPGQTKTRRKAWQGLQLHGLSCACSLAMQLMQLQLGHTRMHDCVVCCDLIYVSMLSLNTLFWFHWICKFGFWVWSGLQTNPTFQDTSMRNHCNHHLLAVSWQVVNTLVYDCKKNETEFHSWVLTPRPTTTAAGFINMCEMNGDE